MKLTKEQKMLIPYVVGTIGFLVSLVLGAWLIQAVSNRTRPFLNRSYDVSAKSYFYTLFHSFETIQAKVTRIRNSAEENERLRLENINFRLSHEIIKNSCNAKNAKEVTQEFELKLSKETGMRVGRSLRSINYQVPSHLVPSQLYTLALAYFIAREDEKAAVLLTHLTGQESSAVYRTPKDLMITGVAWFRLENYSLADAYFDDVIKLPENDTSLLYQAQSRLWRALVAEKLQKKHKAQFWLKELVDHNPSSTEAKWINVTEEKHGTLN